MDCGRKGDFQAYYFDMSEMQGDTSVSTQAPAAPEVASTEITAAEPVVETPAAASPPLIPAPEPTQSIPESSEPASLPTPEIPAPAPLQQTPQSPAAPQAIAPTISFYLSQALEKIQFRKKAKLDKIVQLAAKKRSIKNDDVEKLLRVSDTSATNYLNALVRSGKLKRVGNAHQPTYEPL